MQIALLFMETRIGHSPETYFAIWEALLIQQRKARLITLTLSGGKEEASAGLNYAEALILLIIDSSEDKNVGELSGLLRLERSWVSRIVSSLEKRGLVETYVPEEDKRSRKVGISKQGRQELNRLTDVRTRVISKTFADLSEEEQREITSLLKALADGMGAPNYPVSALNHPIDKELARISWIVGIVGEDFMKSGLNVSRYQIFYELARRSGEYVSASDLSYVFPVDLSTVFRSLVAFCENGLAERKTSGDDARKQLVRISQKGKAFWDKLRSAAISAIGDGVKDMPAKDVKRLVQLLQKVTAELPGRHRAALERTVEVRTISPEESASFLSGKNLLFAPEQGRAGTQRSFGIFEEGDLKGIATLRANNGKGPTIVFAAEQLEPRRALRLLKTAMRVGLP